ILPSLTRASTSSLPPVSVRHGSSLPAAAKAPRAPRAPSSLWPMTALMPGLPCRAAPTSVCAAPRSVMVMWATISASGAVASSAWRMGCCWISVSAGRGGLQRVEDGLRLHLLAGGAGGGVTDEHLGLAVQLLVDTVAELLTHAR